MPVLLLFNTAISRIDNEVSLRRSTCVYCFRLERRRMPRFLLGAAGDSGIRVIFTHFFVARRTTLADAAPSRAESMWR